MEEFVAPVKKSFNSFYKKLKKEHLNDNEALNILHEYKKIYTNHLSMVETLITRYTSKLNMELFEEGTNLLHFAYRGTDGELKWGIPTTEKHETIKEISRIGNIPIEKINIQIADTLSDIKPCLYWYNGDEKITEGIYICISDDQYMKVPFPDLLDGTITSNRSGSIKCKYEDRKICDENHEVLALRFNSQVRPCNFSHLGDEYIKIGMQYRCPSCPSFGRHKSLHTDIRKINRSDVKILLMNSLSDLLLSIMWIQNFDNSVLPNVSSDLEICG